MNSRDVSLLVTSNFKIDMRYKHFEMIIITKKNKDPKNKFF